MSRARYQFDLESPVKLCWSGTRRCSRKDERHATCSHKGVDRFKIFREVKKSLEKQFGRGAVSQTTTEDGKFTVLEVN